MRALGAAAVALALLALSCSAGSDGSGGTAGTGSADPDSNGSSAAAAPGSTLSAVKRRGRLLCGVGGDSPAFSQTQPDGSQLGIDADFCRVLAAVVLGNADDVEFLLAGSVERFSFLSSGGIDVLNRNTTWTQSRDTDLGLNFGPTYYYDGQQVMARASAGFSEDSSVADLDGSVVCTVAGGTAEKNISDEVDAIAGVSITLRTFDGFDEVITAFEVGSCDVVVIDGSALVGQRATRQPAGDPWVIFPTTPFSKEPLGSSYRHGDDQWRDIVNWSVYATFIADEYGVTSANAAVVAADPDAASELRRLFGAEGELQSGMGLDPDAFLRAIVQVGNYDEIFARNLNPVGLFRAGTPNASWLDGGLIYAPPAR